HHLPPDARWNVMAQENVLVQIEHLRTHPVVAAGLAAGEVRLHAWVYKLETGQVFAYDPQAGQFIPLVRADGSAILSVPLNRAGSGAFRSPNVTPTRAI
ncbi:MAG TPA: carbonic anhydrase, partial [Gemmataceae bacterium]|nr:carbonic anhydrase [Gemmataceae bacterium]